MSDEREHNHDTSVRVMIDSDDEERIGLLGRGADLQFARLADAYNTLRDDRDDLVGKLSRQNDAYLAQSVEVAKLRDEHKAALESCSELRRDLEKAHESWKDEVDEQLRELTRLRTANAALAQQAREWLRSAQQARGYIFANRDEVNYEGALRVIAAAESKEEI